MQKPIKNFINRIHQTLDGSKTLTKNTISVGWVDPEKKHKTKQKKGKKKINTKESSEMKLVNIARMLNYGRAAGLTANGHKYPAIPARPFIKNCIDNHLNPIQKLMRMVALDMINKGIKPDDKSLEKIGLFCKGALQRSIKDSNAYAPNAPSTINAKGSARPLIDTGMLVNSVDFEIK